MKHDGDFKSNFLYGNMAGIITGFLLQPLEVIKMNMILIPKDLMDVKIGVPKNKKRSIWVNTKISCNYIYKEEGVKGFYRGLTPALLKATFTSGIYFSIMRKIEYYLKHVNNNYNFIGDNNVYFISSAVARSMSSFIINPITLIKTRAEVIGNKEFESVFKGIVSIYKKEGFRAYFNGGFAIIIRDFPFGGIFNLVYEYLNKRTESLNTNNYIYFINGLIAGTVATIMTQPLEIVRAQLQYEKKLHHNHKYGKIIGVLYDIYSAEGIRGFEKGILPRLMRKPIANALTFYIYELQNKYKLIQ